MELYDLWMTPAYCNWKLSVYFSPWLRAATLPPLFWIWLQFQNSILSCWDPIFISCGFLRRKELIIQGCQWYHTIPHIDKSLNSLDGIEAWSCNYDVGGFSLRVALLCVVCKAESVWQSKMDLKHSEIRALGPGWYEGGRHGVRMRRRGEKNEEGEAGMI